MLGIPLRLPRLRLGGLLLGAVLLAGCTSAATPAPSGAGATDDGPVKPKVDRLVWAIKAPPLESSNPRMICCFDSFQYRPTHENMLLMDADSGKLVPGLAREWKLDLQANTVSFKLRSGVNFQEPEKWGQMTPDDVVHTFETLTATTDPPSNNTWINSFWKRVVKDVKATAPDEVVFSINPHANFLFFMSDSASQMSVRSKKQQAAEPEPRTLEQKPPVGTGGYQWVERKSGSYVRFKRVDYQHWLKTPDFPEFEFRFVNEPSTRMAALLANEIHVTDLPSDLAPQAERQGMKLIANRLPAPRVWGSFRCCYVDPQTGKWPMYPDAPMLNIKVREALNRAINRDELTKAFAPKSEPMYLNHFNKSRQSWDDKYERQFKDRYGFDQAKARQLLAEAGYTAQNPLKIDVMAAPLTYIAAGPDIAEAIAGYWRAVGIQPQMVTMDAATETATARAYKFTNTFRMQSASAVQVYGINIFSSGANPPGSGYWTPEFMDKLNELNGTLDESKQNELLRWVGDFGFNQYWDVPLWYVPLEVAVNPNIVADYAFPGQVDGGFSHFYTIKAAR